MSHRVLWTIAGLAAVPLTVAAQESGDDGCRRGEVTEVTTGSKQPLVVYDDDGEILDENAPLPDASELLSARVVACGKSKKGFELYKVQLNGSRTIWVRTRFVSFKSTQPILCERGTRHHATDTAPRNVDCTQ